MKKKETVGRYPQAMSWDPTGRLTSQSLTTAATGTLQSTGPENPAAAEAQRVLHRGYTYRPDGHLTAIDDSHTGRRTFDLDRAGRVTAVHATDWTETYAYDEAGNQTHATWPDRHPNPSARGDRAYTGTNITRAGRIRYEHDALGRVILRQKTRLSRKPDTWRFSWNTEGRLTSVDTPDGTTWRYLYDPSGRRIAKQRVTSGESIAVEETDFTWDGPTLTEQTTRSEGAAKSITLTWDHQSLAPVSQTERKTSASDLPRAPQQLIDQRFYAIITDLVGTPTELISDSGEVSWQMQATLWGTTTWNSGATAYTPLRFPGQYFDHETQLHYNFHRYYDATAARYISTDPLGITPNPNNYTYVDNPNKHADPLGLFECTPKGEASNPFESRSEAEIAAHELAGVPHGTPPDAAWTVTGNKDLAHAPGYLYSKDPTHWGHFRQFETEAGSRVVVEHTHDPAGLHFHAGMSKAIPTRNWVNFGWDNERGEGIKRYKDSMERYAKINKPGGDHHLFYK
ncbi:RHS repeat-associated core domain-containing protein [Streptomyces caniferus]|uniref:RHS repeat-associated core domain-containing protein n=1 Tax=Streptomyces caniferus TaxID=285557 RepID=UPI003711F6D7